LEYRLDNAQVTYLDPAGLITWENGSDMRDATAYKFNLGSKVFMDAHSTVTAEEGDRYPLEPPSFEIDVEVESLVR
jgi:hypothetical protein